MAEYGISYGTKDEYDYRFQLYQEADKEINEINNDPELTYIAAHNMFSTLSQDEMKLWKGKKPANSDDVPTEFLPEDVMAAEVDWRKKGAVNPVQNQK